MAPQKAAKCQPGALADAVALDRLGGIVRARRIEATIAAEQW